MLSGHFIIGKVLGTRSRTFENKTKGTTQVIYSLGVSVDVPNGFSGETDTLVIKFSQDQVKSGLVDFYNKLTDKVLLIPVWHSSWTSANGSHGTDIFLSGDGKPLALPKTESV